MEISSLQFRSEKENLEITNIYLFTEGLVVFNVEKIEDRILDGRIGDTRFLIALLDDGTNIDVKSLYELDSFSFDNKIVKVEKDLSEGSMAEKKLIRFYAAVPGSGFNKEEIGIS